MALKVDRMHRWPDGLIHSRWDVVVLGAGPAGALTAHELARRGVRVLLVEKRAFPRWKVCGACFNGQAQAALRAADLGDFLETLGSIPLVQFRLGLGGRVASFPLPGGQALSRSRFDLALVEAACRSGAGFLGETSARLGAATADRRCVNLSGGPGETTVHARLIVVAAGLANRCLEAEPGVNTRIRPGTRAGAGCVVENVPDPYQEGTIFMAVGRHGYVGLVRVEDGCLNVAAAFDKPFLSDSGGPAPAAQRVLAEAEFAPIPCLASTVWQRTPGLTRRTHPLAGHRFLVVGDAAGYVEPFTGEGMGWALTSALAVVPLILQGLDRWDVAIEKEWGLRHGRLIGRRQGFCRGLSVVLRHPSAARTALQAAAGLPWLSRWLLEQLNTPSPALP
jgi:flavin-dependent dehydrogenase